MEAKSSRLLQCAVSEWLPETCGLELWCGPTGARHTVWARRASSVLEMKTEFLKL